MASCVHYAMCCLWFVALPIVIVHSQGPVFLHASAHNTEKQTQIQTPIPNIDTRHPLVAGRMYLTHHHPPSTCYFAAKPAPCTV